MNLTNSRTVEDHSEIKASLRKLESGEFESLVAEIWSEMGWSADITQSSHDKGVDIVATKSGLMDEKVVIQAKCYSEENSVTSPEIQQYAALIQQEPNADSVIVVTSGRFTSEAISLADDLNVKTINGDSLAEAARNHLSSEYLSNVFHSNNLRTPTSDHQDTHRSPRISTKNLTESELDLASAYQTYFRYIGEALQRGGQLPMLLVNVESETGDTSEYRIQGTVHTTKFPSATQKLWLQVQKTAKEHDWEIIRSDAYGSGAGGVEMMASPEKADMFDVVMDTQRGDEISAERQAKITNLILDSVYDQKLCGTRVVGLDGQLDGKSFSRVIK